MSCKSPCKECPYQKGSASGYFGGNDPGIYRHAINAETVIPCHMRSEHDHSGEVVNPEPCTGLFFSIQKSCRLPMTEPMIELLKASRAHPKVEEIKGNALASWEFADYHGIEEEFGGLYGAL